MKTIITSLFVCFFAPFAFAQSAFVISPGADAAEELQEALILAQAVT